MERMGTASVNVEYTHPMWLMVKWKENIRSALVITIVGAIYLIFPKFKQGTVCIHTHVYTQTYVYF